MPTFQQLKKQLDEGKKRNLYVFTGDEREVLRQYIKRIDPKPIEVGSFKQLAVKLQSNGLFNSGEHGTYVIHDDKTVFDWEVKQLIKRIGKDTVILVYSKIDKRINWFKKAKGFLYEFTKFTEQQLVAYIGKKMPSMDYRLAAVVARYCNHEISRVDLEIDKLLHLPFDCDIDLDLVNDLITPPLEDRIFEMIDAVAKKQPLQAYEVYEELIEMKESPIKMISLLYTKFKHLFVVQSMYQLPSNELASKTGLNTFQINQVREMVGVFTLEELIKFLRYIQKTEVNMKTGKVGIELGMQHLLLNILK